MSRLIHAQSSGALETHRATDGDLVLVTVQQDAHPGEIVVAMVEDEVTVKRFQMDDKTVVLTPENEAFAPIRVAHAERFRAPRLYSKTVTTSARCRTCSGTET